VSANFDHIENLLLMRTEQGKSEICFVKDELKSKVSYFLTKMFHSDQKDFLFAESVLLVEGDTEYGCLQDFDQKISQSFNKKSISIINVNGSIFGDFIKLFENLKIPYTILCDNDEVLRFIISLYLNLNLDYNSNAFTLFSIDHKKYFKI
jgi:predicted ATP-dependent endonuclease of OLD family